MSREDPVAVVRIGQASGECAKVWAVYGIVEAVFLALRTRVFHDVLAVYLPWVIGPGTVRGLSLTFVAMLLAAYLLVGAGLGLVVAFVVASVPWARRAARSAHLATLWASIACLCCVVLFSANAVLHGRFDVLLATIVPFAISGVQFASAWQPAWRPRVAGLSGPWLVAMLLVGGAYSMQTRGYLSSWTRILVGLAFLVGVLAGALLLRALRARLAFSIPAARATGTASAIGVSLAMSGVLMFLVLSRGPAAKPHWTVGGAGVVTSRPNVILITLDTVRADHLSLYGYGRNTTPNLSRWAAKGFTVFQMAIAASNTTLTTHASIFTGWSPHRHGAWFTPAFPGGRPITPDAATLPMLLANQGYVPIGIAANALFLRPELGFGRGFAFFASDTPVQTFGEAPDYFLAESWRRMAAHACRRVDAEPAFWSAADVNEMAFRFLDKQRDTGRPFFLFLNYMDAHVPYVPPPPFNTRYDGADPSFRWYRYPKLVDDVGVRHSRALDDRTRAHLESQYDGAIAYLDQQLDALFVRLQESGVFDNSLIIVTSDHGEGLGERSLIGHGVSLYQHELRVPLMVKYPHVTAGSSVSTPVGSVDLLPTVLDAIGAGVPAGLDGTSLLRVERGGPRLIVAESSTMTGFENAAGLAQPTAVAVFSGAVKFIQSADGKAEVYNLTRDPTEQTDLGWRTVRMGDGSHATPGPTTTSPAPFAVPSVDPALLERLRALGYVR